MPKHLAGEHVRLWHLASFRCAACAPTACERSPRGASVAGKKNLVCRGKATRA